MPIEQLKQSQTTTLLFPPVQLVKALLAGQRIYLNTGHLKENCQLENMQVPSHATFAKKDNLPIKTDMQEREFKGHTKLKRKGLHNKYNSYKES